MSSDENQEMILQELRDENRELREKLETAYRELADSTRAEVSLQFTIKDLLDKIRVLKEGHTQAIKTQEKNSGKDF
tara:strand:- start:4526 stop:4753 length:228 start_codon:yes stop_codon:yes gene_type:complete